MEIYFLVGLFLVIMGSGILLFRHWKKKNTSWLDEVAPNYETETTIPENTSWLDDATKE
ncbi:MAG: hypothetical protein HN981_02735 [Candidatus Pacebacteria bacterium]|jgi:hypothetical protein|nr:hypothetical protein [Candidatus Paceibacterota bacterium]MBT6921287.1 hypothetical protein [Candidatus Paceibacterota bacterium]